MKTELQADDKRIYIAGENHFQNELLRFYIKNETEISCSIVKDLTSLKKKPSGNALLMIGWPETDTKGIYKEITNVPKGFFTAIFDVAEGLGIEEDAVGRGIKGVFYKQDPLDRVIKGINSIFNGQLWISREVLSNYVTGSQENRKKVSSNNLLLTNREIQILAMISAGAKNEEIAADLYISPNTVKTHIYNIFKKINVPNRLQAALWAAKNL
ncbi:LuxR C-terminal-related transcriptional regulator [Thermodesulfobacteriota bacterium]